MKKPKILIYDLETFPILGHVWQKYDTNLIDIKKDWELASFAYKWIGSKTITCISRNDFRDHTDLSLTKELWKVLDQADIVIAHNGNSFDNKKSSAKFIEHGMVPPSPYKQIDTKVEAKKYFRFTSNSLDDLGNLLGVGRKEKTGGFDLWLECMAGNKKAWKKMEKYNKQDVVLLEKVYLKLLPWMNTHPNVLLFDKKPVGCPKCGSESLVSVGIRHSGISTYRRYQCRQCGGWCRERLAMKATKPRIVN